MKHLIIALLAVLSPTAALAASFQIAPASVSAAPGDSVSLSLIAEPASSNVVSVRAHVVFDPSVLEEESFTYAPGWLSVAESGYDSVENGQGSVIKTAGYPGGITGQTPFATITFRVKSPGESDIGLAGDTAMLDGSGENIFGGRMQGARIIASGGSLRMRSSAVIRATRALPEPAAGASSSTEPAPLELLAPPSVGRYGSFWGSFLHFLRTALAPSGTIPSTR